MSLWTGKTVDAEDVDFARRASAYFAEHPNKWTFTDEDIGIGARLAIKWASDGGKVFSVAVVHVASAVLVEHP
jgi:hypothetical protein